MSRLVLHIGTHKTATTSIQKFFHNNREPLARRGVYYPDYSLIGAEPHYAHLGMVNALSGQHETYSPDQARQFFSEVRARAADHDVTVISAEPFYRHVADESERGVPRKPEHYWPARQAYIEQIAELLGGAEIVTVFRKQTDYAQALYQEQIKATRYRHRFGRFLQDFWFHFDFLAQAEAWDRVFPGLTALSFEHLRATGDVEGAFCAALGVDAKDLNRPPPQNESWPPDLVLLKRSLHATSHPRGTLRRRMERLAEQLAEDEDLARALQKRSYFSAPDRLRAFRNRFAEDNALLTERFLRNVPAGDAPFPETDRKGWVYGAELHPRLVDYLTARALSAMES